MPPASTANLVDSLRRYRLLEPPQLEELARDPAGRRPDPKEVARHLLGRGWLTPYQVNQLLQDRGQDLLIGSYVLLERLGEGGMGQVFKARNWKLNRIVALKVIRKDQLTNPESLRRFHREIRVTSQLSHPNIVTAVDADQEGGSHFLVMEHVEGTDLSRLVKQHGALPVPQACDIIRQAALGLQHAHEQGLIHRDIKPSNLMVTKDGTVKLLDLGLARMLDNTEDDAKTLTEAGSILGTPDYGAPEQARQSGKVDIRADLYALGCTLYYLLTAQVPFPGGTLGEKLVKHQLDEPEPVEQLRPEIPASVGVIVRTLMAKKPEDRYQTPAELAAALAAALQGAPLPARTNTALRVAVAAGAPTGPGPMRPNTALREAVTSALPVRANTAIDSRTVNGVESPQPLVDDRSNRRRWPRLAALGVLLAGLALATVIVWPSSKPAPSPPATSAETAETELKRLTERVADKSVKRDEVRREVLAFRRAHYGTPLAMQAGELLFQLPSPLDTFRTAPHPVADNVAGQPKELTALLGEQRGRHWSAIRCLALRADGKALAAAGDDRVIRLWDTTGLREHATVHLPNQSIAHLYSISGMAYSPDGALLASWSADERGVRLWDLSRSMPRLKGIVEHGGTVAGAVFLPDGQSLVTATRDGLLVLWKLDDLTKEVARQKVPGKALYALKLVPGTQSLITGGDDGRLHIFEINQGQFTARPAVPAHKAFIPQIAVAADGKVVASIGADGQTRVWNFAEGRLTETAALASSRAYPLAAALSPDGSLIAFTGPNASIRIHRTDKPKPEDGTELSGHSGGISALAFLPGGKSLVSAGLDHSLRMWDLGMAGWRERVPPRGHTSGARHVLFAPDDRGLVSTGDTSVRWWDFAAATPRKSTIFEPPGSWIPLAITIDGKTLAAGSRDGLVRLWDVENIPPREWLQQPAFPGTVNAVSFSADGRWLAAAGGYDTQQVRLWGLAGTAQPAPRPLMTGGKGLQWSLAFAPDSRLLAAGGPDGKLRLWDMSAAGAKDRPSFEAHAPSIISSLAFSPDSRILVAASQNRAINAWDLTKSPWAKLATFVGHRDGMVFVAIAANGRSMVSAGSDGQLIWWDFPSGKKLDTWQFPGPIHDVAFANDGRHIATANGNGSIYVIRLPAR